MKKVTNMYGNTEKRNIFGEKEETNIFGKKEETDIFGRKKVTNMFNKRIQNSNLELIDFDKMVTESYLTKRAVTEEFWVNESFRREVKRSLRNNIIFKKKFITYFPELYEEVQKLEDNNKNHLKK